MKKSGRGKVGVKRQKELPPASGNSQRFQHLSDRKRCQTLNRKNTASVRSLDDYENYLKEFSAEIDRSFGLVGARISTSVFNNVFSDLKKDLPQATELIINYGEELRRVSEINAKVNLPEFNMEQWKASFSSASEAITKTAETVEEKVKNLQERFKDVGKGFAFEGNTEQLEKEVEKLNADLEKLYEKKDKKIVLGEVDTKAFRDIVYEIQSAINKLDILEAARPEALNRTLQENAEKARIASEQLKSFGENLKQIAIPEINEDNLEKLQNTLKRTEQQLEELRAKLQNGLRFGDITESVDDEKFFNLKIQIAEAEKYAEALRDRIEEIGAARGTFEVISSGLSKMESSIQKTSSWFSRLNGILKSIDSMIGKIAKGFGKLVSNLLSLKVLMPKASKANDGLGDSFKRSFTTFLKYALGIRSIYVLFNRLRRAIVDGFKNLAQYSTEVNASISLLIGSMNQLKNASASMIAPLLNAFAPAINYIIQLCIRATNAINQLFSALTGKSTWIRATQQTADFAAGLDKANKSAKQLTLGIDELNINAGDEDKGGAGAGDILPEDMFETVPIESKFIDLADKIRDIFEKLFAPIKEAWERMGEFVMNSWKYALNEVWKLIKDIGRDFLIMWNQEATIKMFEDILKIIGDIGLIIGHLARNFREAWNENKTGLHILENIRDIFAVIIRNIRIAADYTVKWADQLDFKPLLNAFERFTASLVPTVDAISGILSDFYTQVLLPLGKWTIEKGLPELLQVFTDFNNEVDWETLRSNLSEFWKHLEPFAETVGEGLIIFIDKISDGVAKFLNGEKFTKFLKDLGDWMDSVTPEDVANGIEKFVKAIIKLKVALLGLSVLSGLANFTILMVQFAAALSKIGAVIASSKIAEFFALWAGGAGTFAESLQAAFTPLQGFITIALGAFMAVKNFVKMLTDGFSLLNEALMMLGLAIAGVGAVILGAPALVAAVVAGIIAAIATIVVVIHDNWNEIVAFFTVAIPTWWEENIAPWFTAEKWYELWNGVQEGIALKWAEIVDWWQNTALYTWWEENVIPWFSLEKWFELANGIKEGIAKKWNEIKTQWITNITTWWNTNVAPWFTLKKWTELLLSVPDAFKAAFKGAANNAIDMLNKVVEAVENMVNMAIDGLNKLIDAANKIPGVNISHIASIALPRIPQFYNGGIIMDDMIFRAGEYGRKEAILPLENRTSMGLIADSLIDGGFGRGASDDLIREQNELLREQNRLLAEIASKDMSFSVDGRELASTLEEANESIGFNFKTGHSRSLGLAF